MRVYIVFLSMVGYCMNDNGNDHFEFVHHNNCADDMNKEKMEEAKFGTVGLENCVILTHINILQRPHQWAPFRTKKHSGVNFYGTLFHICKNEQCYSNPT